MRREAALLGPAAALFLVCFLMMAGAAVAQPGQQGQAYGILFDLKPFGGARAAVGAAKMRSIREKAGLEHTPLAELYKHLDDDDDFVSVAAACFCGPFVECMDHAER
jgi:hypothetical protein